MPWREEVVVRGVALRRGGRAGVGAAWNIPWCVLEEGRYRAFGELTEGSKRTILEPANL